MFTSASKKCPGFSKKVGILFVLISNSSPGFLAIQTICGIQQSQKQHNLLVLLLLTSEQLFLFQSSMLYLLTIYSSKEIHCTVIEIVFLTGITPSSNMKVILYTPGTFGSKVNV